MTMVEQRANIIQQLADCFADYRSPLLTEHSVENLLAQRIYALALGYEYLNPRQCKLPPPHYIPEDT